MKERDCLDVVFRLHLSGSIEGGKRTATKDKGVEGVIVHDGPGRAAEGRKRIGPPSPRDKVTVIAVEETTSLREHTTVLNPLAKVVCHRDTVGKKALRPSGTVGTSSHVAILNRELTGGENGAPRPLCRPDIMERMDSVSDACKTSISSVIGRKVFRLLPHLKGRSELSGDRVVDKVGTEHGASPRLTVDSKAAAREDGSRIVLAGKVDVTALVKDACADRCVEGWSKSVFDEP